MSYLDDDWCDLEWSDWYPLLGKKKLNKKLGKGPGYYRVRCTQKKKLAYIGSTVKDLRENLERLREEAGASSVNPDMKHFAAPCLFTYRKVEDYDYEVSTCHFKAPDPQRLALKCYMFWKYRLEMGESPLCNLGRFHPAFEVVVDAEKGVRVRRLDPDLHGKFDKSSPPLQYTGPFKDADWMGVNWSSWKELDKKAVKGTEDASCIFRVADKDLTQLLMVGTADNTREALEDLRGEKWSKKAVFSTALSGFDFTPTYLLEFKNDMIGGYYGEKGVPPTYQFMDGE